MKINLKPPDWVGVDYVRGTQGEIREWCREYIGMESYDWVFEDGWPFFLAHKDWPQEYVYKHIWIKNDNDAILFRLKFGL